MHQEEIVIEYNRKLSVNTKYKIQLNLKYCATLVVDRDQLIFKLGVQLIP